MPRRKKSASPAATSLSKLGLRNQDLERELQEARAREEELKHRIESLEHRDDHEKIGVNSKGDSNQVLNSQDGFSCTEERLVEQIIQSIIVNSSKANSTVPLCEFERLYRVYSAIKKENEKLRTKYIAAEEDRVFLKQTLVECYQNSVEPSTRSYLEKRWRERNRTRSNHEKKTMITNVTRKLSFSSKEGASTSNVGEHDASLPNRDSTQPAETKFDREPSSSEPPKTGETPRNEPNRIVDHGDAVRNVEIVEDSKNFNFEENRDDVKDSMTKSYRNGRQACPLEDRTNMMGNRFDWVRYIAIFGTRPFVTSKLLSVLPLSHIHFDACFGTLKNRKKARAGIAPFKSTLLN